jgi:hypothetical protein
MPIKYTSIFHCKTLPKLPKNWDFWFKTIHHLATPLDFAKLSDRTFDLSSGTWAATRGRSCQVMGRRHLTNIEAEICQPNLKSPDRYFSLAAAYLMETFKCGRTNEKKGRKVFRGCCAATSTSEMPTFKMSTAKMLTVKMSTVKMSTVKMTTW